MNVTKQQNVGITLGDPSGIGPEITLNAINKMHNLNAHIILYCDDLLIKNLLIKNKYNFYLHDNLLLDKKTNLKKASLKICSSCLDKYPADFNDESALIAYQALEQAADDALNKELQALVTGPVDKARIAQIVPSFMGHTFYFEEKFECKITMSFLGEYFNLALVTHHISQKKVSDNLSIDILKRTFNHFWEMLARMKIAHPKIAVCGLNPHAGERGLLGSEEAIIKEAIGQSKLPLIGPLPSDTVFYKAYKKQYHGVIAMYHDQGLAPFKMVHFDSGIQNSLGLPIVRTSPDHGTAYDLAGENTANCLSMKNAIQTAINLISIK